MANGASARPAGRGRTGLPRSGARSPGGAGIIARSVRVATAALLAIAWLVPGGASAAEALTVSTPYPAVAVAPGTDVTFDITVDSASAGRVDLALQGVPQGWTASLRGGGYVVDGVQTTAEEPATVTLEIEVPDDASGAHNLVLRATQGSLTTDLPITLRIQEDATTGVSLTTDFPSLRGPSDATFPFTLTLRNDTPRDLTFVVAAEAPEGWTATAEVSGQDQAASALVEAGSTISVSVEVTAPENVEAGTTPVRVTATSSGLSATADLQVEITGSYSMTLTTPDNRLNTSGSAGSEIRQSLVVTNTGTAPLEGLTLRGTPPQGWSVRFDPEAVPTVPPGQEQPVTAIITPSGDAIAGDYEVTITGANDQAGDTELALRVTVETSLIWGLIGVAIIIAVLAGLWWVFQRYGRR